MTAEQLKRMEAGRRRAQREREKNARARVRAFRRWIANGSPMDRVPEPPSDGDYAAMRAWESRRG